MPSPSQLANILRLPPAFRSGALVTVRPCSWVEDILQAITQKKQARAGVRLKDVGHSPRPAPGIHRASEAQRLGNTQAITRCGEPLQFHEPIHLQSWVGIFQSWVGIFAQNHTNGAPLRANERLRIV